jgi:hypothetical protein
VIRRIEIRAEDAGNLRTLCSPPAPSPFSGALCGFFGTPVVFEPEVPPGILRAVSQDGTADLPLSEESLRALLAPV